MYYWWCNSHRKRRCHTHPFKHIFNCLANSSECTLYEVYNSELAKCRTTNGLQSHLQCMPNTIVATERERAMYSYLRLIVLKSLPLSIIKDPVSSEFPKYSLRCSAKTLRETICKLESLVEKSLRDEMKLTKGYLIFDGLSESGKNCIRAFAVCVKLPKDIDDESIVIKKRLSSPLLSVSPMKMVVNQRTQKICQLILELILSSN